MRQRAICNVIAARPRLLAQHGRRYDVINTHSSTDSWLVAVARLSLGSTLIGYTSGSAFAAALQQARRSAAPPGG